MVFPKIFQRCMGWIIFSFATCSSCWWEKEKYVYFTKPCNGWETLSKIKNNRCPRASTQMLKYNIYSHIIITNRHTYKDDTVLILVLFIFRLYVSA